MHYINRGSFMEAPQGDIKSPDGFRIIFTLFITPQGGCKGRRFHVKWVQKISGSLIPKHDSKGV